MDFGKAFGFVFEDENWTTKMLTASAVVLIPIFGFIALIGYGIEVIRRVMADDPEPLPKWQDKLVDFFMDGLKYVVGSLVYTLPFMLIACPIAIFFVSAVAAQDNEDLLTALMTGSSILIAAVACVISLYGILLSVIMPVVQIRYAETSEIGACVRVGEIFRLAFQNIGPIIVAQLVVWIATAIVSSVLGVVVSIPICGQILAILSLPVYAWMMIYPCHLYGQLGKQIRASAPTV